MSLPIHYSNLSISWWFYHFSSKKLLSKRRLLLPGHLELFKVSLWDSSALHFEWTNIQMRHDIAGMILLGTPCPAADIARWDSSVSPDRCFKRGADTRRAVEKHMPGWKSKHQWSALKCLFIERTLMASIRFADVCRLACCAIPGDGTASESLGIWDF